jgi:hypothetical protein
LPDADCVHVADCLFCACCWLCSQCLRLTVLTIVAVNYIVRILYTFLFTMSSDTWVIGCFCTPFVVHAPISWNSYIEARNAFHSCVVYIWPRINNARSSCPKGKHIFQLFLISR